MKKIVEKNAVALVLGHSTSISLPPCDFAPYITEQLTALFERSPKAGGKLCRSITFTLGIPTQLRALFSDTADEQVQQEVKVNAFVEGSFCAQREAASNTDSSEEYLISFGEETEVYANHPRGFLCALSTVMEHADKGTLTEQILLDSPACAIRGYRVYMPGHETMQDFVDMLDFLVYYKYNSIILEVGGAMEYKRHPRINEKWVEFCQDMNRYSGRTEEVQRSQHWAKNSIHSENGDGSYLTQQECRMLAAECRRRGIEIIPECPTLSHSDYICLAYPELAERKDDPYPDTYCPSNPDSYRVVFDILDEVIDVFEPKSINIGHDEFYSVGVCERCRDKDKAQIFADDVKTLQDYLAARGVATLMWGEKLLKARSLNHGKKFGGWYDEQNCNGVRFQIPWLFRCADLLPRGVTYLHWYWMFGDHLDDEFHAREYPVVFGNFNAIDCAKFRTRINRGVKGGFVSNWGSCEPEYMQRNFQYFDLISTAYALWSDTYDTAEAAWLEQYTLDEMYAKFSATVKHPLKVVHAAHHSVEPAFFWCGTFILDEIYVLGHYELTYTDGTKALLPVKLGTNVASHVATAREIREAGYRAHAIRNGEGYLFEHLYENPHPSKTIASVTYLPAKGKESIVVDYSFPTL